MGNVGGVGRRKEGTGRDGKCLDQSTFYLLGSPTFLLPVATGQEYR